MMKFAKTMKAWAFSLSLLFAVTAAMAPGYAWADYYAAGDFAGIDCANTIDPTKVRYSQDSISARFSDNSTVQSLIDALNNGTKTAADIPAIRIVKVDPTQKVKANGNDILAGVYTLDNRRLYAFTTANKPIRCEKVDPIPDNQKFKFTTDNNGTSITVR